MSTIPSSNSSINPNTQTLTELQDVSQLIHLCYHRNKNQHRVARWWASFNQLRRSLNKLISALEAEILTSSTSSKKKKRKKRQKDGEELKEKEREVSEVEQKVEFMSEILIPRCYLKFSGVVADNQWATLGLFLMANLARIYKLITPLRTVNVVIEEQDEQVVVVAKRIEEDLGKSVSRDEVRKGGNEDEDGERDQDENESKTSRRDLKVVKEKKRKVSGQTASAGSIPSKPPKKKRKKGGDAFDDLFDSLM